ncbi:MAG: hypothetical protein WDM91_03355 [Rhizomicrobium sp.]
MRILIEAAAAVLFIVSTALLFSERIRASRILFVLVGLLTLASSYVITKHILDATVGQRMHRHHVVAGAPAPGPQEPPTQADDAQSTTDTLLQAVYQGTEGALNRIVRSGTGQASASVGSDTVVDVIVGLSLAVLGVLSQLVSMFFRRLTGAD